jgi:hypothetical protein
MWRYLSSMKLGNIPHIGPVPEITVVWLKQLRWIAVLGQRLLSIARLVFCAYSRRRIDLLDMLRGIGNPKGHE